MNRVMKFGTKPDFSLQGWDKKCTQSAEWNYPILRIEKYEGVDNIPQSEFYHVCARLLTEKVKINGLLFSRFLTVKRNALCLHFCTFYLLLISALQTAFVDFLRSIF